MKGQVGLSTSHFPLVADTTRGLSGCSEGLLMRPLFLFFQNRTNVVYCMKRERNKETSVSI